MTLGASLYWRRSYFGTYDVPNINKILEHQKSIINVSCFMFYVSWIVIFILLFYQSYQQYQVWSQNEVAKFLLPPHQSISYFIFYVSARFFAPYLISLAVAIIFLFSAKILNKKYQERFFYPEEPYFGSLAIFLSAHPGWLFYLIFVILTYLFIHLFGISVYPGTYQRFSAYWLWIPMAIFVILLQNCWLAQLPIWQLLEI